MNKPIRRAVRAKLNVPKPAPAPQRTAKPTGTLSTRIRRTVRRPSTEFKMDGRVVRYRGKEDIGIDLLVTGKNRPMNHFRKGKYLHVSDVIGKCLRKIAISEKFKIPMPSERLADGMGLTFAQGVAMHDYVKTRMRDSHPDKIYGYWECSCKKTKLGPDVFSNIDGAVCDHCETKVEGYAELELFDDELLIVGSPDITLYFADMGAFMPLEIKSINNDDWKELVRAKPEHKVQAMFYWHLFQINGYNLLDKASVLYANKGFMFKLPYKEVVLQAEKEIKVLDDYKEVAAAFATFRKGGALPPRTCPNKGCSDAKNCHVTELCFEE